MKELIKSLRPDCFEDIIAWWPYSGRVHSSRVWSRTLSIESTVESRSPTRMLNISTNGCNRSSSQLTHHPLSGTGNADRQELAGYTLGWC